MALTIPPESPKPIVGIRHVIPHPLFAGTMDNKVVTTTARAMRDCQNVTAVRFNFRGVGKSEGSFDQGKGETEDLSAVLQWVEKTSPGAAIWLAGFSFGAYVAYKATAKFPVARCVLIAPPVTNFAFDSLPVPQIPWCVPRSRRQRRSHCSRGRF